MAKSRLTPDYIEWVLSLNANQALREIHKVNEESKELKRDKKAVPVVTGSAFLVATELGYDCLRKLALARHLLIDKPSVSYIQ